MKHRPSCRTAALITAATGTVLVSSAFGIIPATAATAATPSAATVSTASTSVSTASTPGGDAGTTSSAAAAPTSTATPASPATASPSATPSTVPSTPVTTQAPAPTTTDPSDGSAAPSDAPSTDPAPTGEPAPASTPTPSSESVATGRPGGHGHDHGRAPSYPSGSSQSAPVLLPTVTAGQEFSADLRAQHAEDATYAMTTVEGGPVVLPDGLWFRHGVLGGVPAQAGTFTAQVTATNDCGSASQWIRVTVEPSAVAHLAAVVSSVPAASDGSWTWVAPDGTTSPAPVSVDEGESITIAPWAYDSSWNRVDVADRAVVSSDVDTDVVTRTDGGFTVTFAHASSHVISVSVEFTVEVVPATQSNPTDPIEPTDPTDPTVPTDPGEPTTPAPSVDPVTDLVPTPSALLITPVVSNGLTPVASTTPVATDQLAYTGAETTAPLGWAAGLLAAGAALLGVRLVRRGRHRG